MNGLGGIPDLVSLDNISNALSGSVDKVSDIINSNIANISGLATTAIGALGSLVSGLFGGGWGNGEGMPGPVIPKKLF